MPIYTVRIDGKLYDIKGDREPTEAEAREAVKGYQAAPAPEQTPVAPPSAKKPTWEDNPLIKTAGGAPASELWQRTKDHPVQTGAMLGSTLATGAAGPIVGMLRAALGAAGGAGFGIAADAVQNGPSPSMGDDVKTMAREGATAAAGEGIGRGIIAGGTKLQDAAVSAYERMLKPNVTRLRGMLRMGDTIPERSRNVARELLNDPQGQITRRGANSYAATTDALETQVDDLVAQAPEARGSTLHLTDALDARRGTFQDQWAPKSDTAAYDNVADEVLHGPRVTKLKRGVRDTSVEHAQGLAPAESEVVVTGRELIPRVTAGTARDLTRGTYRNLGDKAYGELKGAATEAHKAAAHGGRAILNEAIPAVEPLNNQISKRIDLGDILNDAVFRSGKHDPIGLGERVIAGGGNLAFLPASLINRPGFGSPVARGLNTTGKAMERFPKDAFRTALLALLGQEQE